MHTPTTLAQEATLVYDLRCKPTTFSIPLQDNLLALIEDCNDELAIEDIPYEVTYQSQYTSDPTLVVLLVRDFHFD